MIMITIIIIIIIIIITIIIITITTMTNTDAIAIIRSPRPLARAAVGPASLLPLLLYTYAITDYIMLLGVASRRSAPPYI